MTSIQLGHRAACVSDLLGWIMVWVFLFGYALVFDMHQIISFVVRYLDYLKTIAKHDSVGLDLYAGPYADHPPIHSNPQLFS